MITMATLTVDFEANAAYLEVSEAPVAETQEVQPGILVDLDQFRCAVGIEVLSLAVDVPTAEIAHNFHIRQEDLKALEQMRPAINTFIAMQASGTIRPSRPDQLEALAQI